MMSKKEVYIVLFVYVQRNRILEELCDEELVVRNKYQIV